MDNANSELAETNQSTRQSKIERVISKYELGDFGDTLVSRWTGDGVERLSLRDLSDFFNRHVLHAAMEQSGMRPLDGEVENTYRLLTDSDVSEGMRQQTRGRLERDGVDVSELERDFVSHQAIYTYLREYRDVTHQTNSDDSETSPIDRGANTINALINRTTAVTEDMIARLQKGGTVTDTDVSVYVDVRITCEKCGQTMPVNDYLAEFGCSCETT